MADTSPAPPAAPPPPPSWRARAAAAERQVPAGPLGNVVIQLRRRGQVANLRALWVLGALIFTVIVGLAYFVGKPLLQIWADGRDGVLAENETALRDEAESLDKDRKDLHQRLAAWLRMTPEAVAKLETVERLSTPLLLPDGTLIAAGWDGTILRGVAPYAKENWENLGDFTADGERFNTPLLLPDGTLIATGVNGTILRGTAPWAAENWETVHDVPGESLFTPLLLPDGTLIVTGTKGTIQRGTAPYERENWEDLGDFTADDEGFFTPLLLPDGTLIATGWNGTILLGTEPYGRENWENLGDFTADYEGFVTPLLLPDGTLIATGRWGTILRGAAPWEAENWENLGDVTTDKEGLYTPLLLPDGTLIATGDSGTILRGVARYGRENWETLGDFTKSGGHASTPLRLPDGTLIVTTSDGTIHRGVAPYGKEYWENLGDPTPYGEGFFTPLLLPDGTLIATGVYGAILRFSDRWSEAAAKLDLKAGEAGDALLMAFLKGEDVDAAGPFEPLPDLVRGLAAIPGFVRDLEDIANQRRPIDAQLDRTVKAREDLRDIPFWSLRRRDPATGDTAPAGAASGADWVELLAQNVPPGILLLFLLATLSGLYRYNLRLAGFHHARADALELTAAKLEPAALDALVKLSDALAADKVEFGGAKTASDQAAEMFTAMINRFGPGEKPK